LSEILNLRHARKRKRRDEKERAAEASRLQHGRAKDEKARTKLSLALESKRLEAHRRESGTEG
jgi:hypothetical protein